MLSFRPVSIPTPARAPVPRRSLRLEALLCALAAAAIAPAAAAATIDGQVFDRDGQPLAGITVRVIEQRGGGFLAPKRGAVNEVEVAQATTDRHGFFTIDLGPRSLRGTYVVRSFDPGRWDRLRYGLPLDRDVTEQLEDDGRAIVACPVPDAPGWVELAREIARVGGVETDRGRILRRQGLPPETVAQNDGVTLWRYPGVVYTFRDGALVDTRQISGGAR